MRFFKSPEQRRLDREAGEMFDSIRRHRSIYGDRKFAGALGDAIQNPIPTYPDFVRDAVTIVIKRTGKAAEISDDTPIGIEVRSMPHEAKLFSAEDVFMRRRMNAIAEQAPQPRFTLEHIAETEFYNQSSAQNNFDSAS